MVAMMIWSAQSDMWDIAWQQFDIQCKGTMFADS
jgi:hypothetical protein